MYLDLFLTPRKKVHGTNVARRPPRSWLFLRINASFRRVHSAALPKNFNAQSHRCRAAVNCGVLWMGELGAAVLLEMLGSGGFTRAKLGGRSGLHSFQAAPTQSYHTEELSGPRL